ncbi:hypothetical protein P153DRAFT_384178 [Dothidotthia symphoricarpi CBS 119687]|uniref:Uncharacterized protein n=1 Tax=Dothidotthia symphoricarpi CBS 119687 TaxID=1392245 RepID=A0A6A6AJ82_9PLEO|nr:uncharacterized protein P153DRAFT_384178 [Dothidotthia symphoricarpi CBS 119687]KAF2130964.1 hypothetical protein P153DRAFT_384178 [Dothidotthia symphoricarpi CBS 119687]
MSSTTATQKKTSILSSFVSHAKEHHRSVNAAYSTYYCPGGSVQTSPEPSRNNSIAMPAPVQRTSSDSSVRKAWKAVKQHHHDMNDAYASFYAPGHATSPSGSRGSSVASTPRGSAEEARHEVSGEKKSKWAAVKKAAVEHHRAMNAAYATTYGAGFKA